MVGMVGMVGTLNVCGLTCLVALASSPPLLFLSLTIPNTYIHIHIYTNRSLLDIVHPSDQARLNDALAVIVLSKTSEYCRSLRCRLRTAGGSYRQVHASFRFGAFGIGCSVWSVKV